MPSVLHIAPLKANSFNENVNQLIFMAIEGHCNCILMNLSDQMFSFKKIFPTEVAQLFQ